MKNVITALQELLTTAKAQVGEPLETIQKIYFGDPVQIPECDLPAITISPVSTEYDRRGTRYDNKVKNIEIRIVFNRKSIFGKNKTYPSRVNTVYDIIDMVEKTDETSHKVALYSICGTVQNNANLPYDSGKYAAQDSKVIDVAYDSSKEGRAFPTYEAVITIQVKVIGDR